MEKISWTDHVRNEDVLLRVKEQRNILHEIRKRKANWIGHILRRNCLLQRVIEGKIQGGIEVRGRQGRRRRKLLDDPKERKGYSHLKEEALDRTMWRARFGRGFGPVARQTTKWMCHPRCVYIYILEEMGFKNVTTQFGFVCFIKLTTCFGPCFRPSSGHKIICYFILRKLYNVSNKIRDKILTCICYIHSIINSIMFLWYFMSFQHFKCWSRLLFVRRTTTRSRWILILYIWFYYLHCIVSSK